MSLKPCTECGQPVSTRAARCPNCGRRDPTVAADPVAPVLFSSVASAGPGARCRECGGAVRASAKVCPFCGLKDPVRRSLPRWVLVAGVLVVALPVIGMMGLRVAQAYFVAGLDSGLVRSSRSAGGEMPQVMTSVPRVNTSAFPARCPAPAPVYVVVVGSVPRNFTVFLEVRTAAQGDSLTKALAKRYDFKPRYLDARRAFAAEIKPDVVGKLRCEPSVKSVEERVVGPARR
jgi:RNA polymerase subunit RPABC4/transcription elongation factor Spt4